METHTFGTLHRGLDYFGEIICQSFHRDVMATSIKLIDYPWNAMHVRFYPGDDGLHKTTSKQTESKQVDHPNIFRNFKINTFCWQKYSWDCQQSPYRVKISDWGLGNISWNSFQKFLFQIFHKILQIFHMFHCEAKKSLILALTGSENPVQKDSNLERSGNRTLQVAFCVVWWVY